MVKKKAARKKTVRRKKVTPHEEVTQTYKWKGQTRIKCAPDKAADVIDRLREENGVDDDGEPQDWCTPVMLLDDVKKKGRRHPLYKDFEWDDSKAAEHHRLNQSRYILRSLEVTIVKTGPKNKTRSVTIRKLTCLPAAEKGVRGNRFYDTKRVLSDSEMKERALKRVWDQLFRLRRAYTDMTEFDEVWTVIDQLKEEELFKEKLA